MRKGKGFTLSYDAFLFGSRTKPRSVGEISPSGADADGANHCSDAVKWCRHLHSLPEEAHGRVCSSTVLYVGAFKMKMPKGRAKEKESSKPRPRAFLESDKNFPTDGSTCISRSLLSSLAPNPCTRTASLTLSCLAILFVIITVVSYSNHFNL
jgi:hypothetical protein